MSRSPDGRRPPRSTIPLRPSPPTQGVGQDEVGTGSHLVIFDTSSTVLFNVWFDPKRGVNPQGLRAGRGSGSGCPPHSGRLKGRKSACRRGQYQGTEHIDPLHCVGEDEELLAEPRYGRNSPLDQHRWF